MIALIQFFQTKPRAWVGCRPLSAAERMARYSLRHSLDMQHRENLGAGMPHARIVDGRPVLLALPGAINVLPKPAHAAAPTPAPESV